jgi:hypothetical protein
MNRYKIGTVILNLFSFIVAVLSLFVIKMLPMAFGNENPFLGWLSVIIVLIIPLVCGYSIVLSSRHIKNNPKQAFRFALMPFIYSGVILMPGFFIFLLAIIWLIYHPNL